MRVYLSLYEEVAHYFIFLPHIAHSRHPSILIDLSTDAKMKDLPDFQLCDLLSPHFLFVVLPLMILICPFNPFQVSRENGQK